MFLWLFQETELFPTELQVCFTLQHNSSETKYLNYLDGIPQQTPISGTQEKSA